MRNADSWTPTKYVADGRNLRPSRDVREVSVASRLITDLVGTFYASEIPRYAGGALLDLGCGKAPLYGFYADYCESVTCIDWANSLHANPHLDHIQDLNEPLALDSAAYRCVLLSDVLEHIRRPAALLDEVTRVLEPGGVLLMNVPFLYGIHEKPYDFYRYTRYALADLAAAAGLEVVDLRAIGGWVEVLANLVAKGCVMAPGVGAPLARAVQWLASRFGATSIGRRVTAGTREPFPLGYVMVARRPIG